MSTVIAVTPDLLEQWLCRLRSGVELTREEQMAAVVFGLGRDREFRLHLTRQRETMAAGGVAEQADAADLNPASSGFDSRRRQQVPGRAER